MRTEKCLGIQLNEFSKLNNKILSLTMPSGVFFKETKLDHR